MLSLRELRRAVALLDPLARGAHVAKVSEAQPRHLVLTLQRAGADPLHVLLCTEPELARVGCLAERPAAPPQPGAFVQLLRARIARARCEGVRIVDDDRQVALRLEGGAGRFDLLLGILGPRSNLYLIDGDSRLVGALRPLSETRSELAVGETWRSPESRPPREGEDRFADQPDASFFAALEDHYRRLAAERGDQELRRRLGRALRRADDALRRKAVHLEADARGYAEAERLKRHGELLKSVLSQVRSGDAEVRARDFQGGEEVVIPLDPKLSPAANLGALFRRARKAEKRAVRAATEQGALEARREELARLSAELEGAASPTELAERPEVRRLLAHYSPKPRRPSQPATPRPKPVRIGKWEVPRRLLPRRYRSSDGLEIWMGRSDEGNDLLSTRLARGNDLFFHVSASPGSHVVLRTEGRSDPPSESVLEACELAVHASKQRKASRVDVHVVPIKNVRKPKGAKPGLVLVTGGRTVHLRRDARRLERVLAARLDDDA